jgi:NADH-quinone oxidoreductase subunit A
MEAAVLPILLFILCAGLLSVGLIVMGGLFAPKRSSAEKQMPYESGMDPIHDTRRRFDIRFHLVAIAFLLFDVEILFMYPWAVASRNPEGVEMIAAASGGFDRGLVLGGVLFFLTLVVAGLVYEWKRGVLRWR